MLLVPNILAVYHTMFSVPNLALENAMACRVYRAVKLGFIDDHQGTHFGITVPSLPPPRHELIFKRPNPSEISTVQVSLGITRTTDVELSCSNVPINSTSLMGG